MTPTPLGSARPDPVPAPAAITLPGRVGSIAVMHHVPVFFLAVCHRCGPDLAVPFRDDEDARDDWAVQHVIGTGHVVQLTIDGFENLAGLHMTGLIRRELNDGDGFKFLCTADECKRWNGPYDSPQLAIVSWRAHRPAVSA